MNIVYSITAYPPSVGGAQLHTALLARHLAEHHLVSVISLWDSNRTDWLLGTTVFAHAQNRTYLDQGIVVNRLGFSSSEKLSMLPYAAVYYPLMGAALPHIAAQIEAKMLPLVQPADILHNVRIGREPLSFATYRAAKKLGIPFVFTPLHHPRWSGWRHWYYQQLYRQADALIALTEAEKKVLIGLGVDEKKIFVTGIGPIIAESANPADFRQKHHIGTQKMVLFLGQKYAYKGIHALLKAAKIVWQQNPDAFFVFIGPRTPYSRKLFEEITDPRIIELDTVDLQTKTDALAACDLLCVPSLQESFGGVYTEAWSVGKPVIGCRIPAVSEVIDDGINGLLGSQDEQHVADCITTLLNDAILSNQFGQAGQQKVRERYSWQKLADLTLAAYQTTRGGNL